MNNTFRQTFVETKFIGPTNQKGARIKAINVTTRKSLYIGFHTAPNHIDAHEHAARLLLGVDNETGKQGEVYAGDLLSCGAKQGYMFTVKS